MVQEAQEVICWALNFGIPIYDPNEVWANLSSSWEGRIPMPSQQHAEERSIKNFKLAQDFVDSGDEMAASDLLLAALTQYVRAELIRNGVFPASRPELPNQLREIASSKFADLLDDAMHSEIPTNLLIERTKAAIAE